MKLTKLDGQPGHNVGAHISKDGLSICSGSRDIEVLVILSRENIAIQNPSSLFLMSQNMRKLIWNALESPLGPLKNSKFLGYS